MSSIRILAMVQSPLKLQFISFHTSLEELKFWMPLHHGWCHTMRNPRILTKIPHHKSKISGYIRAEASDALALYQSINQLMKIEGLWLLGPPLGARGSEASALVYRDILDLW